MDFNDHSNNQSMWLQNSIHLPQDAIPSNTSITNDSFAAPEIPTMTTNHNNTNNGTRTATATTTTTFRRAGNRLPSLALCHDYKPLPSNLSQGDGSSFSSAPSSSLTTPRGSTATARASVAGAHSQQLFALQEQVTLAKASTEDFKVEIATLQTRIEVETKATKRWQDRAEQEERARVAAEKKLQDARFSDSGEMASLRDELAALDQALRDERRKSASQKAEAIRQLTEQFEHERENQEKWWKESAAESAARIAQLEHVAGSASSLRRDLEVAQRNEIDLRGHVESLRAELDNAQNSFDMELRQQAMSLRDESTRALLKQEDDFLLRVSSVERESAARVAGLRERILDLEEVARSVESLSRDLGASQEMLKERECELSLFRRQAATHRAQLEAEHEQEMERVAEHHRAQVEQLVSEHNDELSKMRTRVAAAATLNERCNRLEKLANEHLSSAQKHEAELQAVLTQLGDLQRAALRAEQERDEWKAKHFASEEHFRQNEQDVERRVQSERAERENQCRTLQLSLEQLTQEHREMEEEYEANLEGMLARISTMETTFAQQEASWQKERLSLRAAEGEARRANLETSETLSSMQSTINLLSARLEEANNNVAHVRRERDLALAQLDDVKSQASEQQRIASKSEVELAAAKSTVRALETRLEVVRAGSVAAASSSSMNFPSSSSGSWNSSSSLLFPTFALPSSSSSSSSSLTATTKPGQVVEIADNNNTQNSQNNNIITISENLFNNNNNNNNKTSVRPTTSSTSGGSFVKSAIVSRANSSENNAEKEKLLPSSQRSAVSALADSTNASKVSGVRRGRNNNTANSNNNDDASASTISSSSQSSASCTVDSTRVVDADGSSRVFAFTGFEPSEIQALQKEVESLGARVVDCKANSIPPRETTHLVSNGLMTMKLLVTLSRGCWVVPSSYVHQCVASRGFVDESANGGVRHESPFFSTRAVAFSPAFRVSRHAQTASTVIAEGGATVVDTSAIATNDADVDLAQLVDAALAPGGNGAWPKMTKTSGLKHRMLICTSQEAGEIKEYLQSSTSGGNKSKSGGSNNNTNHNNNNGSTTNMKDLLDVCTWDTVLKRLYPQEELRV